MSFEKPPQPDVESASAEKPSDNASVVNRMSADELESFINEAKISTEKTKEQIKSLKSELLNTQESLKEAEWYEFILRNTECTRDQVAYNTDELSEATKVYVGPWSFDVYQDIKQYPNVSDVWRLESEKYSRLLRNRVIVGSLVTDSHINTPKAAIEALIESGVDTHEWRDEKSNLIKAINKIEFSQEQVEYKLVEFSPRNLGFEADDVVSREIFFAKAQSLGLELCPPEVAVFLEIQESQKVKEAEAKGNKHRYYTWNLAMDPMTIETPNGESYTGVHFYNSAFRGYTADTNVYPHKTIPLDEEYVFLDTKVKV